MAPAGTANSLNTRDMILLRQGKPIDLQAKEPVRGNTSMVQPSTTSKPKSGTMLNGESYPPIKQKYEPISLPLPKNPSSIEIPPPPKPYQPIGAQFE